MLGIHGIPDLTGENGRQTLMENCLSTTLARANVLSDKSSVTAAILGDLLAVENTDHPKLILAAAGGSGLEDEISVSSLMEFDPFDMENGDMTAFFWKEEDLSAVF
ncbi:uncharacterized protein [Acropora muricata]|uniref:uncharacterized protein n=1 Tax=Acropora muricata TaxID=159855 RepID=UPI0034E522C9